MIDFENPHFSSCHDENQKVQLNINFSSLLNLSLGKKISSYKYKLLPIALSWFYNYFINENIDQSAPQYSSVETWKMPYFAPYVAVLPPRTTELKGECFAPKQGKLCESPPAVTRLTVYRRPQVVRSTLL